MVEKSLSGNGKNNISYVYTKLGVQTRGVQKTWPERSHERELRPGSVNTS